MAAPKLPCFNYQAMTAGKEKDFGLTSAEIRPIWEYAKKRYLDNGFSYEETVDALSRETGAPHRFFAEVFAGPKSGPRVKTAEMLRKEDARRNAKYQAQRLIAEKDWGVIAKTVYRLGQLPRAALTFLHSVVFPVTHAGGLLLRPTAWGKFLRGEMVTWKSWLSKAAYERARLALTSEANYGKWRTVGLRVGVEERPTGIIAGFLKGEGAKRAWLGLTRIRYDIAEQSLKRFKWKTEAEQLEIMRNLAEIANHSTGVTNWNVLGRYLSKGLFAPQLTMSKWMRATHDPWVTVRDFSKMMTGRGNEVTAGQRAAAYTRLRNTVEMLSTWAAGLYLNQQILNMMGSKQQVNWNDPSKSDWLRFKSGYGDVFSTHGVEEALRLYGQLAAIGWKAGREIHGRNPIDEAMERIRTYVTTKISPGIEFAGELFYGTDVYGRPLPPGIQKARGLLGQPPRVGTPFKEQYTWKEYLTTQHIPIFLTGAARDIYEEMKQRGLSEADAKIILHAAILTAGEFFGFGAGREPRPSEAPTRRGHKAYHGGL